MSLLRKGRIIYSNQVFTQIYLLNLLYYFWHHQIFIDSR